MHGSLKAVNKLCYQRDVDNRQRIHKNKLATMRPTSKSNSKSALDNNRPMRQRHLELNLKQRQMDDEQYTKIEHENRILMEKMYGIMKTKKDPRSIEFSPGLRIDSNQGPMVDCYLSKRSNYPGQSVKLNSLNTDSRRRDYMRIMEENMSILKRIQDRKPNYVRKQWTEERSKVEGYLKNIANDATTGYLSRSSRMDYSMEYDGSRVKLPSIGSPSSDGPRSAPQLGRGDSGFQSVGSESDAAMAIQSVHRGRKARRDIDDRDATETELREMGEQEAAATALQSRARGRAARGTAEQGFGGESTGGQEYGEYEATGSAEGATSGASSPRLFMKGQKIGDDNYLLKIYETASGIRVKGVKIGTLHVLEWNYSGAQLSQDYGSDKPWLDAPDWHDQFLSQLTPPAPAAQRKALATKGKKIANEHYLLQVYSPRDGYLLVKGMQVETDQEIEWKVDQAQLAQQFGTSQPWVGNDGFFESLFEQLDVSPDGQSGVMKA